MTADPTADFTPVEAHFVSLFLLDAMTVTGEMDMIRQLRSYNEARATA